MILDDDSPSTSRSNLVAEELYGQQWCRRRRFPSSNRVAMLASRELGSHRRGIHNYRSNKDLFTTVSLSREVIDRTMRELVMCWSPMGDYLISFQNLTPKSIRIYKYLGAQQAKSAHEDALSQLIELKHEIVIPHQDFSIRSEIHFMEDGNHLIVVTNQAISDNIISAQSIHLSMEGMPLSHHSLDNYIFYCVDIEAGAIQSSYSLNFDRISTGNGVSVSGQHILINSPLHQRMTILHVHEQDGIISRVREIGSSVNEDDDLHLPSRGHKNVVKSCLFSGFKQRLSTFLYNRAKERGQVLEFLRSSRDRDYLRLDRTQLFDSYYVLIRMMPNNVGRDAPQSTLPCFFVVMDWRFAQILDVFDKFDNRFYEFFLSSALSLTFPMIWGGGEQFSIITHLMMNRIRRRGDYKDSPDFVRRLLSQLPFSTSQQYKLSLQCPYVDPSYYSIEDRLHGGICSGKVRTDVGDLRFTSRRSSKVLFYFRLSTMNGIPAQVSLLFHPIDPFCLAVDRQNYSIFAFDRTGRRHSVIMMRSSLPVREMHVAVVGMNGSGKSAISVKYITKRFIGEYDSHLEDTYCRQDSVGGQTLMVWLMDTVDDPHRDDMRWLSWADVYLVVYDITSQRSLQFAEGILERVAKHEHHLCSREHRCILLGNKNDLERYRQVSESDGEAIASLNKAQFAELSATGDPRLISQLLHSCFQKILTGTRSPSPRLCSSDSEIVTPRKSSGFSLRSSSRSSQVRSKAPKPVQLHKTPSLSKIKTGSKLLKLFHN